MAELRRSDYIYFEPRNAITWFRPVNLLYNYLHMAHYVDCTLKPIDYVHLLFLDNIVVMFSLVGQSIHNVRCFCCVFL